MQNNNTYKSPIIFSIVLHALIFVALFLHFSFSHVHPPQVQPETNIIKAVAVNPNRVQSQIDQIKQEQQRKQQENILKEEQARIEQQRIQQQKVLAEKQQQELIQQEKMQLEKAAQQEKIKQQQQTAALIKQKAEKKQKELAQKLKQEQQQDLQRQIEQEQKQLAEASAKQNQSEIDKYRALIIQAIQENWILSETIDKSLTCELMIHVGPGGSVLSVEVARSSGNAGLDNSARTAVFKASPLPVPSDPKLFEEFRQLRLTVKPENIVQN